MEIRPIADRVLVQPKPAEEMTAGGIIIPTNTQEKPLEGVVKAVGNGTKDVTMEVAVGDRVLYGKYAGTEVTIDGETLLIMKQNDLFAVIK